jgi:MFS family permease
MPHAGLRDVLRLARFADLRRVGMIQFLVFGGYLALLGMLPRTLAETGMPIAKVGLAIAAWLVVAAFANFVGPTLSDRLGRRKPFIIIGAIVAGSALLLLSVTPGSPILLLSVAALGGGCFAPLLLAMPAEIEGIGPARAGAALGFLMLIGQAGGFILPALAGAALQARGFSAAIAVLALAHLAILIPALGLADRAAAPARVTSREAV